MSEIEQLKMMVSQLTSKLATLEHERTTKPQGIDPGQLVQAMVRDPLGTMRQLGMNQEQINHVKTVGIADYLGPNAPLQMQIQAASGPQQVAVQQHAAAIADLGRQVAQIANSVTIAQKRQAFNAIPELDKKAPNLSKMLSAKPADIQAALDAHGGSVEEFITAKEAELAAVAAVFSPPPPASTTSENTVDTNGQSVQTESAPLAGGLNDTPAPKIVPESGTGKWADKAKSVKERLVQRANKQMGLVK